MGKADIRELLEEDTEISAVEDLQGEDLHLVEALSGAPTRSTKDGTYDRDRGDDAKRLHGQRLRKMTVQAENELKRWDNVLATSQHLAKEMFKKRVIREVFSGAGRTSECLKKYPNVIVETFSLKTGWDSDLALARKQALLRLRQESPDELLLSRPCRLWCPLQELNIAKSENFKKQRLIHDQKGNHDTFLIHYVLYRLSGAMEAERALSIHGLHDHGWPRRYIN